MTESQFKEIFIATFLANWCASNYEEYCMSGKQGELENPPVEDAKHLADKAWQRIQEVQTMALLTGEPPKAWIELFKRESHDTSQHIELFQWKDKTYRCWIVNLESLRPVIKKFGKHDAFNFNDGEHFEELRQAVMLEF